MTSIKKFIDHKEAIAQIAIKFNIPKKDIKQFIESFNVRLKNAVRKNKVVAIKGFGKFKHNHKGHMLIRRMKHKNRAHIKREENY